MAESAYNVRRKKDMIRIKLYNVIANERNRWWYSWDGTEDVFSLAFVKQLLADNADETDFAFDIHCPGGEVEEGLAIYDTLRTSGKNIHMNIEGSCHSMALTLLLAAPKEYRTANPNCTALMHEVQSYACGSLTELENEVDSVRKLQNSILDIYADRTDKSREELEVLMKEQKVRTASELLSWGFIGSVNSYNTNLGRRRDNNQSKNNFTMAKNLKQIATDFLNKVGSLVGQHFNFDFTDAEGNVLFSTEREDDTLEVGDAASPDGTFTIADGRTVVIADGVITEIQDADNGGDGDGDGDGNGGGTNADDDIDALRAENARLTAENTEMRAQLTEAANIINNFRKEMKSNFQPKGRVSNVSQGKNGNQQPSSEARKNAVKEALHGKKSE